MIGRRLFGALAVVMPVVAASPALAFDPAETFKAGTYVVSLEGGGGEQHNIEGQSIQTGLEFWNAGLRLGLIPWGPINHKAMYGAAEFSLEPFYQSYEYPLKAYYAGLGVNIRYHFLSLGRFVPYVEIFGSAGETNLKTPEVASRFTFLIHGGFGGEYFIANRVALYLGYRLQHVSNGGTNSPNRGFESHTGVTGISFYFP